MAPTFQDGDRVAVDPNAYSDMTHPIEGDVVLARHPFRRDVRIVKRVARLTPEGRCFLVGDNPDTLQTTDSRSFGAVEQARILGRVLGLLR